MLSIAKSTFYPKRNYAQTLNSSKLDDDTNGEDRAVNEYAINQGFGNIINIYNIKNERVYFHTVKQLEGITYKRIYCRGEY